MKLLRRHQHRLIVKQQLDGSRDVVTNRAALRQYVISTFSYYITSFYYVSHMKRHIRRGRASRSDKVSLLGFGIDYSICKKFWSETFDGTLNIHPVAVV